MKLHLAACAAALSLSCVCAFAQTSTTTTTTPTPTIHERKVNQQDRIAQGLKSGQMTASEAAAVEKQEAGINTEERGMRAQDNGKLTTQDKQTLNSQLTTESKDIYQDKHNAATQPTMPKGEVNRRLDNQQGKIASGITSDTLSDKQVAHLETQEAGIGKEESGMRAQDNGKLSAQDKKTLNHQLNQESRRISRDERRTAKRK